MDEKKNMCISVLYDQIAFLMIKAYQRLHKMQAIRDVLSYLLYFFFFETSRLE